MAITYTREYDHILDDLSRALISVPLFFESFEMEAADWDNLISDLRDVCIRSLVVYLFYVLGTELSADVGEGSAEYDPSHSIIKVTATEQLVHVIPLRE